MATPHLELDELSDGTTGAYLLVNASIRALESAVAGRRVIDFPADADHTLNTDPSAGDLEWQDKFIEFTDVAAPLTAAREVEFPAKNGPEYIIKNSTGFTLTLKISGQSGVTIADGVTGRFYYDGTDIVAAP